MAKDSYVETKTHLDITTNSLKQDDNDPNLITFESPLVIADGSVQKNGTRYDIPSLDISPFRGKLWANHDVDRFENALAKVIGLRKEDGRITIDGLKFFSNSYAQLAKDMMLDGAADEFSIGTRGQEYDEFGVFYNHQMHELSLVGIANNYNAHLNGVDQLAEFAVQNGFDLKKYKLESNMTEVQKADEAVKTEEVKDEEVKTSTSTEATEETTDTTEKVEEVVSEDTAEVVNSVDLDALASKIADILPKAEPAKADFTNTIEEKQTIMTTKVENGVEKSAVSRFVEAIKLERNGLKDSEEFTALNELAKDTYKNALGDTELGALIAPAELIPEPTKCSPKYQEFLSAFQFRQGRLAYSLNNLYSNVRFVVAGCGVPATQSGADINNLIVTQETLRTYTPVCNKNIEFSEIDVANLFENEYQVAFDRALVEYAIGQFQVAVETRRDGFTLSTGREIAGDDEASVAYPDDEVSGAERADALAGFVEDLKDCADGLNLVMTKASVRRIVRDLAENGVLEAAGSVSFNKSTLEDILDTEIVIVPKGVLPTVGSGDTVTIQREGAADITVDHAIFAIDPSNFLGLYAPMTFDVSSEASYEVEEEEDDGDDGTRTVTRVRSPKLYDETVLWGRMHRGGGVRDLRFVAGVQA